MYICAVLVSSDQWVSLKAGFLFLFFFNSKKCFMRFEFGRRLRARKGERHRRMVISDRASWETKTKTKVVGVVGRGGEQFDLPVLNQCGKSNV